MVSVHIGVDKSVGNKACRMYMFLDLLVPTEYCLALTHLLSFQFGFAANAKDSELYIVADTLFADLEKVI